MKGLILAGGKGTRLRPLTYTGAKQLVPVANKPVLFYAIEHLVEAGITEIGIVVGDTADQIMTAVGDGSKFGAVVTYIRQDQPLGIAHGVKIAEPFIGKDRFVLFLGDNFIRDGIIQLVERFRSGDFNALIILKKVLNPQDFGVAEVDGDRVVRLVEKPKEPKSNLAVIGIYMFDHHVFEAVKAIKPSARGELEITETIQYLIDSDLKVAAPELTGWWIDTGKMEDMLEANRLVLETFDIRVDGTVDGESRLDGKVVIEKGAQVIGSVIRGPVIIGERTRIVNSFVGPFSSIDHDCLVINSEIEHSIVLDNSVIRDLDHRIADSLIGRNVEINRSPYKPKSYKLMLGDHSKVGLI
ncbi:MAG: glucose-1-phosphate thymidylyltransferase [Dehalococcoidia bacterium]|nr:glucose-1-phosphate thymidylyltransferase [Dehalococcoidia bacterium]